MARSVKPEAHVAKRSEILDAAQRLIYVKGYERMAIQDILDELKISKGAFYHYFDSKQAVLEALVERMGKEAEQSLLPIVEDPQLPAIQKFRRYFEASSRWKSLHKPLIVGLMRMWYADENALIRQKMIAESLRHMARIIAPIIHQGIAEKVFTTRYPDQAAGIIAGVAIHLSDSLVALMISPPPGQSPDDTYRQAEDLLGAYIDAVERIIGAPAGSLDIFAAGAFREWFVALQPAPEK